MRKVVLSRGAVEDLNELGAIDAWGVVLALSKYYTTRTIPEDLTGEQKLCFTSIVCTERERGSCRKYRYRKDRE